MPIKYPVASSKFKTQVAEPLIPILCSTEPVDIPFLGPIDPSSFTINLGTNWIFFSEHNQEIETRHPFLHHSPISNYGYYVPGNMNISSWFRPLEYAFQGWPNVREFKVTQGDPLLYVNFPSDEKIVLKRFHLTEELFDASISCIRLKFYWREKNLKKLLFESRLDSVLFRSNFSLNFN